MMSMIACGPDSNTNSDTNSATPKPLPDITQQVEIPCPESGCGDAEKISDLPSADTKDSFALLLGAVKNKLLFVDPDETLYAIANTEGATPEVLARDIHPEVIGHHADRILLLDRAQLTIHSFDGTEFTTIDLGLTPNPNPDRSEAIIKSVTHLTDGLMFSTTIQPSAASYDTNHIMTDGTVSNTRLVNPEGVDKVIPLNSPTANSVAMYGRKSPTERSLWMLRSVLTGPQELPNPSNTKYGIINAWYGDTLLVEDSDGEDHDFIGVNVNTGETSRVFDAIRSSRIIQCAPNYGESGLCAGGGLHLVSEAGSKSIDVSNKAAQIIGTTTNAFITYLTNRQERSASLIAVSKDGKTEVLLDRASYEIGSLNAIELGNMVVTTKAIDGNFGRYVTDGTKDGSYKICEGSTFCQSFTPVGDELWFVDGDPASTKRRLRLSAATTSSNGAEVIHTAQALLHEGAELRILAATPDGKGVVTLSTYNNTRRVHLVTRDSISLMIQLDERDNQYKNDKYMHMEAMHMDGAWYLITRLTELKKTDLWKWTPKAQ